MKITVKLTQEEAGKAIRSYVRRHNPTVRKAGKVLFELNRDTGEITADVEVLLGDPITVEKDT